MHTGHDRSFLSRVEIEQIQKTNEVSDKEMAEIFQAYSYKNIIEESELCDAFCDLVLES